MNGENHPTSDTNDNTEQGTRSATRETPLITWIEYYNLPEDMFLPEDVGTYNGRGYPRNQIERFVKIAMRNSWSMPMACHVFDRSFVDLARVWMDSLPRRSVLDFGDPKDCLIDFFKPAMSNA